MGRKAINRNVLFKIKPQNNNVLQHKITSESRSLRCNRLTLPNRDTRAKGTIVVKPMFTPLTQKLCRSEHTEFTSKTVALNIRTLCNCLWSI